MGSIFYCFKGKRCLVGFFREIRIEGVGQFGEREGRELFRMCVL